MAPAELDADRLLETFLAEAEEQLTEAEQALVALESQPQDDEALQAAFRAVHTLKGNASSMGFGPSAEVAHVAEDLLDRMRSRRLAPGDAVVSLLLQAIDSIRRLTAEKTPAAAGFAGTEARGAAG